MSANVETKHRVGAKGQPGRSRVLLCVGTEQVSALSDLGLGRKNWSESWIRRCAGPLEARSFIMRDSSISEAWVFGSDDMDALNLAAGLKRERDDLKVALLCQTTTGSLVSRCDAARVAVYAGRDAVTSLFRLAQDAYGLVRIQETRGEGDMNEGAVRESKKKQLLEPANYNVEQGLPGETVGPCGKGEAFEPELDARRKGDCAVDDALPVSDRRESPAARFSFGQGDVLAESSEPSGHRNEESGLTVVRGGQVMESEDLPVVRGHGAQLGSVRDGMHDVEVARQDGTGACEPFSSAATLPFEAVGAAPNRNSFVLSVVSGSGGSGKSSVAALVGALSQSTGAKTLVLDADFQFGDEQWLLGQKAPFDLVELVRRPGRIAELASSGNLPAVVAPPQRLEESEPAIASISKVVNLARQEFDIIVVNTGSFWMDAHLDLLEHSDRTLFLMDQRPTSIRACSHAIELCVRCGLPMQRFEFALNRCGRQALLSSLDASCALKGVRVRELRDGGNDVAELLGAGLPLELLDGKNPFVSDLAKLVFDVLPVKDPGAHQVTAVSGKKPKRRRSQKFGKRRAS